MRALVFVVVALAAGMAQAQVYRWADENGKVHYGDKPPAGKPAATLSAPPAPGSGTQAIPGGTSLSVPLPKPSAQDLEIQRRQEEYARKSDEEREAKERAAMRSSPEGIYHCQVMEQHVREAQQGFIRQGSELRRLSPDEKEQVVPLLIAHFNKDCR